MRCRDTSHIRMNEADAVMQVRTGTSKSTKGHRDPALTWDIPAPLQEGSFSPAQQVDGHWQLQLFSAGLCIIIIIIIKCGES